MEVEMCTQFQSCLAVGWGWRSVCMYYLCVDVRVQSCKDTVVHHNNSATMLHHPWFPSSFVWQIMLGGMCVHTRLFVCVSSHVYVCVFVRVRTHVCVCVCVSICV